MQIKPPPFQITTAMIDWTAKIAALSERLFASEQLAANPVLRRTNRIRTIYGSLAIEQNTLNLEQVTAVINGKHVLAPPKDIAEVQNAFEIYEHMDALNPYSIDDLLTAHGVLTRGLLSESGMFRSRPVGVVDQQGNIVHFGTLPQYVPDLVQKLFAWAEHTDVHMLIRSCVVHYELELIHPFLDGNGRVGRLWHTLMLSKWNPSFAWLPIESVIHDRQSQYYAAINASNDAGESTVFIEFMLSAIYEALQNAMDTTCHTTPNRELSRWHRIELYLQTHPYIMNADVRMLCGVSSSTANRILRTLTEEGKLIRYKQNGHWAYRAAE